MSEMQINVGSGIVDLNKFLVESGRENGLCEPWAEEMMKATSKRELMRFYIRGIDFCLSNNYPNSQLLKFWGGDIINDFGVYVDQNINLTNSLFTVLHGNCIAKLAVNGYSVTQLFIKDNSFANITASENSYMSIDAFDNSKIEIETKDNANVLLNLYGNASVVNSGTGKLKIIHKNKLTY